MAGAVAARCGGLLGFGFWPLGESASHLLGRTSSSNATSLGPGTVLVSHQLIFHHVGVVEQAVENPDQAPGGVWCWHLDHQDDVLRRRRAKGGRAKGGD